MPHDLTPYFLGGLSAFLVGMSKTGVPGVSIPGVLLVTLAFSGSDKLSVGALLPVLLVGDVMGVLTHREHTQWKSLARLFPAVAVGMVPAAFVLWRLSDAQFKTFLGLLILVLLVAEWGRRKAGLEDVPHRWWFTFGAGAIAGFSSLVGNAAGPVMTIYLLARGFDKHHFMGTWVWFFLIVNATKVPILAGLGLITFGTLAFSASVAGMVIVGALAGRRIFDVIPQKVFDPLVLALTGFAAVYMVAF